jgi:thiosulfate reductase cytochrome b subunit
MENNMVNIYLYTRYERYWQRLQTMLVIALLITGFEINGAFTLLGFKTAHDVHNSAGLTWHIAFAFFVFWLFTTGERIGELHQSGRFGHARPRSRGGAWQ